ncbi:hypothetical protein OIU84_025226 [Salix udensis]|uniref:Uncharacterized protein n=1 Tax=Salix udensis TaxID=889485 RepID=A0AAD6KJ33_9ROSI|nr:hypothetical protein OIU84_025226 [Salix udensis]
MKLERKFKESGFGFSPVTNQFKVTRMISQCAHDIHTGEERYAGRVTELSSYHPINVKVLKDSGVKESWTRVFSTATLNGERWPYGLYQPMKYMDDGALLVFPYSRHARIHYDPRDLGLKHFKFHGVKSKFEVIVHTPSFISLKDALLGDDMKVRRVETAVRPKLFLWWYRNMETESDSSSEGSGKLGKALVAEVVVMQYRSPSGALFLWSWVFGHPRFLDIFYFAVVDPCFLI